MKTLLKNFSLSSLQSEWLTAQNNCINPQIIRNREILELQYRLLQQELKCTETTSGVRQKILESSLGQYPHHTAAITLAFEGIAPAENISLPFSIATTTLKSNKGGHSLPAFAPHNESDPTNSRLILSYQSISCMPYYHQLSFEVRFLKYCSLFGLKYGIVGDWSPPLLWNAHPTLVGRAHPPPEFFLS